MNRRQLTPENALVRLETLCARSEHCSYEILTKLRTWGIGATDAQKILDSLIDRRFVDDRRFAGAFARDKYRFAGHGRMKIRLALAAKRIPRDIIDDAMTEINPEEYAERLRHLLSQKASRLNNLDSFDERVKLYRFGVSRGFESDLVNKAIKSILAAR